jgi:hypothetical protein
MASSNSAGKTMPMQRSPTRPVQMRHRPSVLGMALPSGNAA